MASGRGTVGNLVVQMSVELGKLRTDVKEVEKTFTQGFANIKQSAVSLGRDLAGAFGVGLSVSALVAFGKSVFDLASRLSDLSKQTGITASQLLLLKPIAENSGTSVEDFANSITKLQIQIGQITDVSDPAYKALKELGISFDEIANARPDQSFKILADALDRVSDSARRDALAFVFFGRSWVQIKAAMPEITKALGQTDEALDAEIELLDKYQDKWNTTWNNILRDTAAAAGYIIQKLEDIAKARNAPLQQQILRGEVAGGWETSVGHPGAFKVNPETGDFGPSSHQEVPPHRTLVDKDAAKAIDQAKNALDSFIESLQKQHDALKVSEAGMYGDAVAAKRLALDLEFAAFKQKLFNDGLKLPPGAEQKFNALRESILGVTTVIEDQKKWIDEIQAVSKTWLDTIDQTADAEQKFADLKIDLEQYDDLGRTLTEISKKYMKLIADATEWARVAGAAPEEIETATRRLLINRALEQVRARVEATGEGVDPQEEARKRAEEFGNSIADSITSGIRNTLMGIETGQQSIGEGMKNLMRNIMLEMQFALLDESVFKPLKAIASGFIEGLVGGLDEAANTRLRDWAVDLGKSLNQWLSEAFSSAGGEGGGAGSWISRGIGLLGSLFGGMFGGGGAGSVPIAGSFGSVGGPMERGGPVLAFASGGMVPILAHSGEFVMNRRAVDSVGAGMMSRINQTGQLPASQITLDFQGAQIIPRAPWTTPEDVVKVGVKHINDDGMWVGAMANRMSRK